MRRPVLTALGAGAFFTAAAGRFAQAKNAFGLPMGEDGRAAGDMRRFTFDDVMRGWDGFSDVWLMLDMALVFVVAVILSAVIAYHPLTRRKASSIEELEQPKTFIMYAMVGAMIALVVQVNSVMGLVVFGIGGLLRFRTNVGNSKATGRVILATVVGVCCGVKLFVVAVFATAFGWVLIWYLESQDVGRVLVKGLSLETIPRASEAYRQLLTRLGCKILGEKKSVTKNQVVFVVNTPRQSDREWRWLEDHLSEVPEDLRGTVDWEVS